MRRYYSRWCSRTQWEMLWEAKLTLLLAALLTLPLSEIYLQLQHLIQQTSSQWLSKCKPFSFSSLYNNTSNNSKPFKISIEDNSNLEGWEVTYQCIRRNKTWINSTTFSNSSSHEWKVVSMLNVMRMRTMRWLDWTMWTSAKIPTRLRGWIITANFNNSSLLQLNLGIKLSISSQI